MLRAQMKSGMRIALWIIVACLGVAAVAIFLDRGGDAASRGLGEVFGIGLGITALAGAAALLLGRFWRAWLIIAGAIVALPFVFIGAVWVLQGFEHGRNQRATYDMHSGRADFGEQATLLAVAEAISKNDENAIRAAAKNVPDLNAAGKDGKTLLFFAVNEALERPELVKAVEVLLSLGADPNYNNGQLSSFAMWRAVNGETRLLRAMLDHGGNPNGPDFRGDPIIFYIWNENYFVNDQPARLRLLLDRGADVNSTLPATSPIFPGYTILLFRARGGVSEPDAYVDALELLNRGADPNRVGDEGMTLAKMLAQHRAEFANYGQQPSPEYAALVGWLSEHGVRLDGR